ncbi:hemolysin family protein [Pseudoxanthobacter sp.]|uniref:hemolysin family protein n=1 Tax=Pseudoxanthobacter sp. TaxID=1925742 RepID=UPI002FDF0D12
MNDETSSTTAVARATAPSAPGAGARAVAEEATRPAEGRERSHERHQPAEGWLARLMGAIGLRNAGSLRESLESALAAGAGEDGGEAFSPEERLLLQNILRLRTLRVEDVMIPRSDIVAADAVTSLAALIRLFLASGHSRMPIYRESLDDPLGMVHIKDLMAYIATRASAAATPSEAESGHLPLGSVDLSCAIGEANILRPVLFVPPSMPAGDLIARMKAERMQIALVIDEFGGTDGLVSLEDLIETVLGDIEDEHDQEEEELVAADAAGRSWTADARIELEDLAETIGPDFDVSHLDEEDIDTLGGLIYTLVGRIPHRGETIAAAAMPGFGFEILDADPRRVKRVRIFRREPGEAAAEAE